MTYAEFQQAAWDAAPPLRKRVVGRQAFNELLQAALASWSGDATPREMLERVRVRHQHMIGATQAEYGFIWVFLLSAAASALIQWLIQRWLDRNFTSEMLQAWRQEMAS